MSFLFHRFQFCAVLFTVPHSVAKQAWPMLSGGGKGRRLPPPTEGPVLAHSTVHVWMPIRGKEHGHLRRVQQSERSLMFASARFWTLAFSKTFAIARERTCEVVRLRIQNGVDFKWTQSCKIHFSNYVNCDYLFINILPECYTSPVFLLIYSVFLLWIEVFRKNVKEKSFYCKDVTNCTIFCLCFWNYWTG